MILDLLKSVFGLPYSQQTITFNPDFPIIEVPVRLVNGQHEFFTTFALDTGATYTVIEEGIALFLNLSADKSTPIEITTASGSQTAQLVTVPKLYIAGLEIEETRALITELPEAAGITGLLGLSTLRNFDLRIDFSTGRLQFQPFERPLRAM